VSFECAGRGHSFYQHYDRDVTDHACRFLKARAESRKPFAAVTGFILPHCPYIGPKDAFDDYYDRVDVGVEMGDEPACIRAIREREQRKLLPPATDHQLRVARAAYYAMIEFMDGNIGRILDTLDQTGQAGNTLVLYCSDHGDMMGHHGLWSKKVFYERAAGIPLIARLPGLTSPGTTNDSLCSLIDLAPTFAQLAGTDEMDADGTSLLPLLNGTTDSGRVISSEVADVNGGHFEWVGKMVRRGPWKLWQHQTVAGNDHAPVLFNLEDDPSEEADRSADPDCSGVLGELQALRRQGWRPGEVTATVRRQLQDWQIVHRWGATVRPTHPDTYVWPGPETETDLELL
jgi:choline-sulfatase